MNQISEFEYEDLSIWDINSIINYIKEHYIKLILLISVPIIIYTVDHITNINAMMFGFQSAIPGLSAQQAQAKPIIKIQKKRGSNNK